ncbi:hypothetical protein [Halobaculum magnesiiphilum]|uniref:Uncharacterized protein n=1 Tax=Halobaculum magnesiiphilum TaxID=1017351 RepID=A0A8T8WFD3_9EURY|nr:hypothetical protein [Halobaculum magnesiiphilum]QZP38540.1 hypothetical protein K6T50_05205 [Halobaculum magnesiiphilum]
MSSVEGERHNGSASDLPLEGAVFTRVREDTKEGVKGFLDNPLIPSEAQSWFDGGGNVGVALGREPPNGTRLVAFDVEQRGVLPDRLRDIVDQHALATWDTVHEGRNRLVKVSEEAYQLLDSVKTKHDLTDDGDHDLELLTDGHVLAPGSEIDHGRCRPSKPCNGSGRGSYRLVATDPDAPKLRRETAREILDILGVVPAEDVSTGTSGHAAIEVLTEVDEELADVGDAFLRDLQHEHTPGFNSLVGMQQGGDGGYENLLWKEGEDGPKIDRSLQELMALTRLYEVVVYFGNEEGQRAKQITRATFERYVHGHKYTEDGQVRRWLEEGESYKRDRLGRAFEAADRGKFQRFLNRQEGDDRERWGDYSVVTYGHVRFAVNLLVGKITVDPEDPDLDGIRDTAAVLYEFDLDRDRLAELLDNPPTPVHGTTPNSGCVPTRESPHDGGKIGEHENRRPEVENMGEGVGNHGYPEQNEVVEACQQLDPSRDRDTHEEALRRLRRDGIVKQARVGRKYLVYPSTLPDPENACCVKCNGEEYDPREETERSSGEVHLRTDGGTDMSTTTSTNESSTDNKYTPETLRERFPTVVRGEGRKSKKHHIPDEDSDDVEPLCGTYQPAEWIEKEIHVFPLDWHPWCEACLKKLREQERADQGQQGDGHGNVLEAEWG